jgi:hypothetical protein
VSRSNSVGTYASGAVVSNNTTTRLHGRWLVLARILWVTLVALTLGIFIASLPDYFTHLQTLCQGALCAPASGQLTFSAAQFLHTLGITISGFAIYTTVLEVATALIWLAISAVIFWRKSNDWMALLASLMLILMSTANVTRAFYTSPSIWRLPVLCLNQLTFVAFFLFFALFPNGRFVPRWISLLVIGFAVEGVLAIFFPLIPSILGVWSDPLSGLLWFSLSGSVLFAQIYRYRNVSSSLERQQTKWVLFGVIVLLTGDFVVWFLARIFPSLSLTQNSLVYETVSNFALLLIPLSISIAILRYRLWDIDIIINRTLVYGTITITLALVYAGLVIGLGSLVRLFIGQLGQSPIVIVASTLAVAALFQPLRHRIQAIIDRRFYRRKYDAAQIMEAFSATLRDEVDLSQLSERLITVVQETMQPAHVSLWLRKPSRGATPSLQTSKAPTEEAKKRELNAKQGV